MRLPLFPKGRRIWLSEQSPDYQSDVPHGPTVRFFFAQAAYFFPLAFFSAGFFDPA
jgi:hypothetical protein